jgi:hypothetical protein
VFELNTKIKRKVVSNLVLFFILLLWDGKHKLVFSTVFFPLGWKAQACAFQKIQK